ncbi:hypothetical protein HYH03_014584 [Edaphochlamys debaryana]|uniref:Uncharacterized protein n=1 Tax=Edaphochlamys debaryana TaxID=47281 RepID=A0A835XTT6_9CHLO|nr:hypothetical protein HYH03_014584 [Edaphochlamys debaryana]|eukprot:KAG2486785.1 hypothetical protein HYH03_014584 [Edaphochlamys debaryana]
MPNDDRGLDGPDESATSFGSLPPPKVVKYAWALSNEKVNHENFHRMLEEYRNTKKRERELELKIKQLGAQLARTEEAAKRALVQTDATAKGGAAQKLLDSERAISKLRSENAELASKLAREKKKSADFKAMADSYKQRLDGFLKDQRSLVKKVGHLERTAAAQKKRPEDEFWGEEAGRRFVIQQEELVALKEENAELKALMESDGPLAQCKAYEQQVQELQNLVKFYERKITVMADAGVGGLEALYGPNNGPGPEDWILEEFWHNDEMYLLDRKTGKLFTVPGDNSYPRPLGVRTNKEVKMGNNNAMERFLTTLDSFLANNAARLSEVFNQFDLDNSGALDRRELARMLQTLMPDLNQEQIEELRTMLDVDGDGVIALHEILECIKEAFAARTAAKIGKHIEMNDVMDRIRDVLRDRKKDVAVAFDQLDLNKDGCLSHLEVVRLVRQFLPDMYQKEVRYLLAKLQQWDVAGESKISFEELYQALELVKVFRVGQGIAAAMRTSSPMKSPGRAMSPGRGGPASPGGMGKTPGNVAAFRASVRATTGAGGMKEAFLRERVGQLEVELRDAQRRNTDLEDDAKKVETLTRDAALYKARIEDLERDFMKIDVLGHLEGAAGDEQLQKAWEIASTFKKRYMEHKGELDNIRIMYARMQAQLEETHKLLHEEHRKRFKLEDEITRLNVELMKVQDLENRLNHEKAERVKLEREYLSLQQKALSAPGEALAEVRALREELFAVKREKATAQAKEAEVRLELTHTRALLDGMDLQSYRVMQDEADALKKRVASLTLELQAAHDKLAVYMKDLPNGTNVDFLLDEDELLFGSDRRPDADKTPEELRRELIQLRDVWRLDQGEIKKLHKVLETESAITMEAKAALEEAHREMDRVKRELQHDMKKLEREIERREEKIRKLELQLRGAYSGINRALRSSGRGLRDSLRSDTDDFSEIGEDQNIFELHITESQIYEESLGKDPSVFFTFDFFMHESQATPIMASNAPNFNTIIQYVVDNDPFLLEYLDTHVLALELCRARGYDYDVLGVAKLPLRQVLEDLEIGAALGYNRAYHYVDVFGADGKRLGRVRYGYCFRRPLDSLLKEYRLQARQKRPSEPDERDPATQAVQLALTQAGNNQCIKVIIERCEQLVPAGGTSLTIRPYAHYRFPGCRDYHDTRTLSGVHPVYNDEAVWPIARTPELEADFRTRNMAIVVFDDAQSDDPLRAIIGIASVPLTALASGVPVEGAFKLTNPVTRQPAGRVVLGLGWHNPLALPGAPAKGPAPRVPISSEPQEGGPPADFSIAAGIEELLPISGAGSFGPSGFQQGGFGPGGPGHPPPRGGMPPQYGQPQFPKRPPSPHESQGLMGELGGAQAAKGSGWGAGVDQRGGVRPQQPGPQQQQPLRPSPYGAQPPAQQRPPDSGGFGLAAEAAARQPGPQGGAPYGQPQGQPPYGQPGPYGAQQPGPYGQAPYGQPGPYGQQGQPFGQQGPPGQPPYGQPPYGQGQQSGGGDFGLDAEARTDQFQKQGPYGQQPPGAPYGQQPGAPYGLPQGAPYGQQPGPYGQQPYGDPRQPQRPSSTQPGRGPSDFGLGAELQDGAPQRQPSGNRPPLPPPGSLGAPPPSQAGSRFGGAGSQAGGSRRGSEGSFGLDAEAASQRSGRGPGGRPLSRQPSGGSQGGRQTSGDGGYGLGAEMEDAGPSASPPRGGMMLGGRTNGRARYAADTDQSMEAGPGGPQAPYGQPPPQLPPDAALGPVLRRERPDPASWTGLEHRIVLCLHSIEFTPEALRNPRLRNVVLMHALLSEQEGISELDTCTQPLSKGPGQQPLSYCVSYNIVAGTAAQELLHSLGAQDDFSVEVKLMSTNATRLDMNSIAQPGTLQTAGYCMLPLWELWQGRRGNVMHERFDVLEDSDDMTHVATVTVSLVAEAALRTLRALGARRACLDVCSFLLEAAPAPAVLEFARRVLRVDTLQALAGRLADVRQALGAADSCGDAALPGAVPGASEHKPLELLWYLMLMRTATALLGSCLRLAGADEGAAAVVPSSAAAAAAEAEQAAAEDCYRLELAAALRSSYIAEHIAATATVLLQIFSISRDLPVLPERRALFHGEATVVDLLLREISRTTNQQLGIALDLPGPAAASLQGCASGQQHSLPLASLAGAAALGPCASYITLAYGMSVLSYMDGGDTRGLPEDVRRALGETLRLDTRALLQQPASEQESAISALRDLSVARPVRNLMNALSAAAHAACVAHPAAPSSGGAQPPPDHNPASSASSAAPTPATAAGLNPAVMGAT